MTRLNKLKRNILYVQAYYFFRSFIFAYVIERLFWRSRGISIAQTVYIEIIYGAVIILMEVPTGVLADRFSRKNIILSGSLLTLIGAALILNAYGFAAFAGLIVLSGISGALTSGSVTALMYDSLQEIGETMSFEKYLSRIKAIRYGSGLLAAMIGAYAASKVSLILPYQMSVFSCMMMVIFNALLTEPNKSSSENVTSVKEIFKTARAVISSKHYIQYIFITGGAIGAAIIYIEEFWQNYMDGIQVDIIYFGLISGLMSLSVLIASSRTTKIITTIGTRQRKRVFYTLTMLISAVSYVSLFLIRHPLGLLFMLVPIYIQAVLDTVILGDLHHNVESHYRATMESVYSMFNSLMSVILGLGFAYASKVADVFYGYLSIGSFLIVIVIGKIIYFKKKALNE
ncbi:MFS transporter [Acidaminobacter sp. JC074]|uniref:MFS transporter n=1 Tax=Acidaminobacter sp. JC074 TaxID=2530199 RepID=UPI001F0E07DF|nr:MFS transporter [Acidaminobacter sp. JC074]MCH4889031.1 MFS transporter [Acidaminobacter sp. JC074]